MFCPSRISVVHSVICDRQVNWDAFLEVQFSDACNFAQDAVFLPLSRSFFCPILFFVLFPILKNYSRPLQSFCHSLNQLVLTRKDSIPNLDLFLRLWMRFDFRLTMHITENPSGFRLMKCRGLRSENISSGLQVKLTSWAYSSLYAPHLCFLVYLLNEPSSKIVFSDYISEVPDDARFCLFTWRWYATIFLNL